MRELGSEAFFGYLQEREKVRLRKEADLIALEEGEAPQGPPWTDDPILREYKFTNVRRQHDRTSAWLIENFYRPNAHASQKEILLNCAIARYFGHIDFVESIGWTSPTERDLTRVKKIAKERRARKERVFTGAYVITNGGISAPKEDVVVDHYLRPLLHELDNFQDLFDEGRWEWLAKAMMKLPGFGGTGFMTKETLLDTTYTSFWAHCNVEGEFTYPMDWWDWTPIGPGALRGGHRVRFGTPPPSSPSRAVAESVIGHLVGSQTVFPWDIDIGRLAPTDIQFGLCEFDKYERVRLGEGRPKSRYKPRDF